MAKGDAYHWPVPLPDHARCPECGFPWSTGVEDAIAMVGESPLLFAQALASVDAATTSPSGVWSPTQYLWHMVDVLRIGTERLWTLEVDADAGLPSWDENDLARVRRYGDLSASVGMIAYERAVETWVGAAKNTPPGASATHSELGALSTADVIRRNAHEAQHHLLDIEQAARRRSEHVFIARSPSGSVEPAARPSVATRLFDDYVMVDWSAGSSARMGKDSIWIAQGWWHDDVLRTSEALNVPTRHAAMAHLEQTVDEAVAAGRRLVIGFDFPFSYPAGLASLAPEVFGPGPPWEAIWRTLSERVRDEPDNTNNRWDVAKSLNRDTGYRLFWGCPAGYADPSLGARDKELPGLRERPDRLGRLRLSERRAQEASGVIQTVWKLAYAGSVGSQTLLGIPFLQRLRARYGPQLRVWPFEVAAGDVPAPGGVTLAEIWPSMFPTDFSRHPVRDAAQVLQTVESCADADATGAMSGWLSPPALVEDRDQVAEEGWILGVT